MKIVIIGSGNVATVLGRLFKKKGFEILQVVSRNLNHAELLSKELLSGYTDYDGIIDSRADIYIMALLPIRESVYILESNINVIFSKNAAFYIQWYISYISTIYIYGRT